MLGEFFNKCKIIIDIENRLEILKINKINEENISREYILLENKFNDITSILEKIYEEKSTLNKK